MYAVEEKLTALHSVKCFFANIGSQAEAWRYNSTFDRVQHGAIAAWLR